MQPMQPMQPKRFSRAGRAMQRASLHLSRGGAALALALTLLFSLLVAFCTYLFAVIAAEVLYGLTDLSANTVDLIYYVTMVLLFLALALPCFIGRIRMAGLSVAGEAPPLSALFYYYTSPRRWGRSLLIGLIYPFCLLIPPLFPAVALAVGQEHLGVFAALARATHLCRLRDVLAFLLRVLCHLLLSALTFGVLWILYYAHHTTLGYWELVTAPERDAP